MSLGLRIEGVAKTAGLSVSRAYHVSLKKDFPPPRRVVGGVKFWAREDIQYWLTIRKRKRTK
jgi:predicted DNA-binding transcriptional regulator AlpA